MLEQLSNGVQWAFAACAASLIVVSLAAAVALVPAHQHRHAAAKDIGE